MLDSADQILFQFTHNLDVEGILRARVYADTAFFFQRSQTADLRNLKVEFFTPQGAVSSTVTSREGSYFLRTRDMEARGNVVAVTEDGGRLTTTVLRYNRTRDELTGPEAFVFVSPERNMEGDAFVADPELKDVRITRARRGRIGEVGRQ
jgi:LPS export ABC transporter protein LptC